MAKTREYGPREKITALIPFDASNSAHLKALDSLRLNLCYAFGGFTQSEFSGGWVEIGGRLEIEQGFRFEVSYYPDHGSADNSAGLEVSNREKAIDYLSETAHACGNTWVHIERTTFAAEHRRVK